jgi:hypothetical protein
MTNKQVTYAALTHSTKVWFISQTVQRTVKDFTMSLRMVHNLELMISLYLKFSIYYF